jgi:hypothetical protein
MRKFLLGSVLALAPYAAFAGSIATINFSPGTLNGANITTSTGNPAGYTFSDSLEGAGVTASYNSPFGAQSMSFAQSESQAGAGEIGPTHGSLSP